VAGFATARFARTCIAIASADIGSLVNGVTSAMASDAIRLPRNRLLRVMATRPFAKTFSRAILSVGRVFDINGLRITDFICGS
jgi:hypothetical protein